MELLTLDEIVRLTPQERLALIAQLWDSLEHGQLSLTSLEEDRRKGVTWASLKAERVDHVGARREYPDSRRARLSLPLHVR
jgi:putative addiction module component (TIGR02574 family)